MGPKPNRWQTDLIRAELKRSSTRIATNKFIEMVEEGLIDPVEAVRMCVKWMSEDDVAEMMHANELDLDKEDTEDDAD